jgi:hypothetical protein
MTERKNVVQRKRSGSFMKSLGPVTKIFPLLTLGALVVFIIGTASSPEIDFLIHAGIIALPVSILAWAGFGFASAAKARGSDKPFIWGLSALIGFLLAPIGTIIFLILWSIKLGHERCGFCLSCKTAKRFAI